MRRTDRSVTFLAGMIIAGLYVILLVGFSQESYMQRDAAWRSAFARNNAGPGPWPVIHDASKRMCRIEPPLCATLFPDVSERQGCIASISAIRQFVGNPFVPLTLQGLRHAMRENP